MINKYHLAAIIMCISLLLLNPIWALESSFYLNGEDPSTREKVIITTLKELILYQQVLNILQPRKKRALEHLHSAKNVSERRYWSLVVLKYKSLELYYLSRALECLINLNLLFYPERKELPKALIHIRILRTYLNQDPLLSQSLYLMERKYLVHEPSWNPPDFKSWIFNLRERYLALKRAYSQLEEVNHENG